MPRPNEPVAPAANQPAPLVKEIPPANVVYVDRFVDRLIEVPIEAEPQVKYELVEVDAPRIDRLGDLFARAAWTAAQSGLAVVTVEALEIPVAWAVPAAWLLSVIKTFVARKVGNPNTNTFR